MERLVRLSRLFDYYGSFLSERQRVFLDASVNEDLSLAEIAEREQVSRQAVRDGIVHAEAHLEDLENTLHLAERTEKTRSAVKEMIRSIRSSKLSVSEKQALLDCAKAIENIWED